MRTKPRCDLCRQRVSAVAAVVHELPRARKRGVAGGRKRIDLCAACVFQFSGIAVRMLGAER
jgi:hypothetical protein